MTAQLDPDLVTLFGGEAALAAAIADFQAALQAHAATVGQPAPAAHWLVEEIVRRHGGQFTIATPA